MLSSGSVSQSALDQGGIQERAIQSVTNTRREEEGLLADGLLRCLCRSTGVSYTRSIEPSVTCPLLSIANTLA